MIITTCPSSCCWVWAFWRWTRIIVLHHHDVMLLLLTQTGVVVDVVELIRAGHLSLTRSCLTVWRILACKYQLLRDLHLLLSVQIYTIFMLIDSLVRVIRHIIDFLLISLWHAIWLLLVRELKCWRVLVTDLLLDWLLFWVYARFGWEFSRCLGLVIVMLLLLWLAIGHAFWPLFMVDCVWVSSKEDCRRLWIVLCAWYGRKRSWWCRSRLVFAGWWPLWLLSLRCSLTSLMQKNLFLLQVWWLLGCELLSMILLWASSRRLKYFLTGAYRHELSLWAWIIRWCITAIDGL